MYVDHVYADPKLGTRDVDSMLIMEFLLQAEFAIPSVFVILALILLIQSLCWPLRAALGWQITIGDERHPRGRRFGMSNMLAWIGFFAVFFYLVILFRDNPLFFVVVAIGIIGTVVTLPVVAGWLFLLGRRRVTFLLALICAAAMALLGYLENEAALYAQQQIVLAGGRLPPPPLRIWAPQIVPFNGAAAVTAFVNLLVLRYGGVRLRSVKLTESPNKDTPVAGLQQTCDCTPIPQKSA
jgi:hypothetical protein